MSPSYISFSNLRNTMRRRLFTKNTALPVAINSPREANAHRRSNHFQIFLFAVIIAQTSLLLTKSQRPAPLSFKDFTFNQPSYAVYNPPIAYPKDAVQVQRIWHSNGSPTINPGLKSGSCWCSADEWCMCTPSLAIDTILTSGEKHFWLVKRKDAGKYATMGGFVEVGETSEDAVHRELMEEMHIKVPPDALHLFGVYTDPKRDSRRHTASIVYVVDIPDGTIPHAGDDAAEVLRIHHDEVEQLKFFADHKTILRDYISKQMNAGNAKALSSSLLGIKRDLCLSAS